MASLKTSITQNDRVRVPALAPIMLVKYGDYERPHTPSSISCNCTSRSVIFP